GLHALEHGIEKDTLEVARRSHRLRLGRRVDLGRSSRALCAGEQIGGGKTRSGKGEGGVHHITSMSAWIAPAALIACRMAIRSRGPMPSAFRPSTSCCSETPSRTTANFLPSSCTPMRVRGTVTVVPPRENGVGWLT